MLVRRIAAVVATVVALPCCYAPSLLSQSSLVPLVGAGPVVPDHGAAGLDARSVVRPVDFQAGGAPTPSALYAPRAQLELAAWYRANRYLFAAFDVQLAFAADSYSLTPTTLARPSGEATSFGFTIAGDFPLDPENHIGFDLTTALGQAPTLATYLPPDLPMCPHFFGPCMTMPRGPPYTRNELPALFVASALLHYAHRFGPVRLVVLAGAGTQPVNGSLGGSSASMSVAPVALLGGGVTIDIIHEIGVQLLVVFPVERLVVGPLLSIGLTFSGDTVHDEPARRALFE